MTNTEKLMQNLKRRATFAKEYDEILYVKADDILTLLDVIDSTSRVPSVPVGLDPNTKKLVVDFCAALAEKLYNAEVKYGRQTDWMKDDWYAACRQSLWEHIAKGDPRDVAAYCAFMWYHGWKTEAAQQPVVPECFVRFHDIIKERHHGRMPEEVQNAFNECADMIQAVPLTNEGTNNCREIAETPTGFDNLSFDEHRKYIGLANIEIRRFQTIPDKKYIADLLTIAVNSLYESINTCGEVSSPAIPEGYVMVPKEPTDEMISSGIAAHYDRSQIQIHDRPAPGPMECAYVAMLAAAPQEVINYEKSSAQPFAYYANNTYYNTYKAAIKDGNEKIIALYDRDIDIHNQEKLRELVDLVWNTATESTEVPSTKWADELITKVFGVYKNDN